MQKVVTSCMAGQAVAVLTWNLTLEKVVAENRVKVGALAQTVLGHGESSIHIVLPRCYWGIVLWYTNVLVQPCLSPLAYQSLQRA